MEHIISYNKQEINTGFSFETYFGGLKVGVLDIETTGLSPKNSRIILGGLVTLLPGSDELKCEEFFSEYNNDRDEKELLTEYMKAIHDVDLVVTYNGQHFDMPYLEERCRKLGVEYEEGLPHNLDIYTVLNKYSELRKVLPNLRQKSVEAYAGLWKTRTDEISGKDSIDMYYGYLSHKEGEGKKALKATIMLHNSDDCMQLYRLIPILGKTDIHKAMYNLGFPVNNLSVESISYKSGFFDIKGKQRRSPIDYVAYPDMDNPMQVVFEKDSREFSIKLPVQVIAESEVNPKLWIIDGMNLGIDMDLDKISVLPDVEKGYIIIKKGNEINYLTINMFVKGLLDSLEKSMGQSQEG